MSVGGLLSDNVGRVLVLNYPGYSIHFFNVGRPLALNYPGYSIGRCNVGRVLDINYPAAQFVDSTSVECLFSLTMGAKAEAQCLLVHADTYLFISSQ
jgi:hypothetical protein